jgi:two-component system sensor histidine kinase BaeS
MGPGTASPGKGNKAMRSISLKITLVLVIISLVGALFTAFFIQNRTRQAFDDFIRGQDQQILVSALIEYYQTNSSWEGVDQVFGEIYSLNFRGYQNRGMGMDPGNKPFTNPGPPFVLISPSGVILTGGSNSGEMMHGNIISNDDLEEGIAIEIEGEIAGWLIPVPFPKNRNNIQQDFLGTVQQGLVISSLVTLLIALILGGILIQSFTRPIRKLADATERVASGDLGYQVEIKSSDELGKLANSFNSMSADLEKADQARKQMTADIAHDLRTPLSVLHGYTEAMGAGKLVGSPEIYQVMHQQAQYLNYLIDDLSTLSLLDSNELNMNIQVIDPGTILQRTKSAFASMAAEKGIQLSLELDQELPRVKLDPDRLNQILGNLISNALDVLDTGGKILLSAGVSANQLQIKVGDNGPGIKEEDLDHLFERFFRTDKSRKAAGSSGLGLAITKKLVEAQGGIIQVESQEGVGTIFRVIFPVANTES